MHYPVSMSLLGSIDHITGIRIIAVSSEDIVVLREARGAFSSRKSYSVKEITEYWGRFSYVCLEYHGERLAERLAFITPNTLRIEPEGMSCCIRTYKFTDSDYKDFVVFAKFLYPSITADTVSCDCDCACVKLDAMSIDRKTLYVNSEPLCFWTPRYTKNSEINSLKFTYSDGFLIHSKNKTVYVLEKGNVRHTATTLFEQFRANTLTKQIICNSSYLENNSIFQDEKEFDINTLMWRTNYKRVIKAIDGCKSGGVA